MCFVGSSKFQDLTFVDISTFEVNLNHINFASLLFYNTLVIIRSKVYTTIVYCHNNPPVVLLANGNWERVNVLVVVDSVWIVLMTVAVVVCILHAVGVCSTAVPLMG